MHEASCFLWQPLQVLQTCNLIMSRQNSELRAGLRICSTAVLDLIHLHLLWYSALPTCKGSFTRSLSSLATSLCRRMEEIFLNVDTKNCQSYVSRQSLECLSIIYQLISCMLSTEKCVTLYGILNKRHSLDLKVACSLLYCIAVAKTFHHDNYVDWSSCSIVQYHITLGRIDA